MLACSNLVMLCTIAKIPSLGFLLMPCYKYTQCSPHRNHFAGKNAMQMTKALFFNLSVESTCSHELRDVTIAKVDYQWVMISVSLGIVKPGFFN